MKFLKPIIKTVVVLLVASYVFAEASTKTLVLLSLLMLWLAILPGALIVALAVKKPLNKLETWILGTALGISILPVLNTVGALFTDDAALIWNVVVIAVSLLDLVLIAFALRKQERSAQGIAAESITVPIFSLLLALLGFLAIFLFQRFYRDSAHGIYSFNMYFGGDMGCLGSDVLCLEARTTLQDWQFGGWPASYHDFAFRLLAGLHRISGGNIYDALWYFESSFALLTLFSMIWLVVKKLTKQRVMAWMALGLFLLGRGMYLMFVFDSVSMQLGLVECFAALYFLIEAAQANDAIARRRAALIYGVFVAFFAPWKLTLVMVLVPALFVVALVRGVKEKRWGMMMVTLGGSAISGLFFLRIFAGAGSWTGPDILGRPLWTIANFLNRHHHLGLAPVMRLSNITVHGAFSLLTLLPIYAAMIVLMSGRFMTTLFVFPKREFDRYSVPYAMWFFVVVLFLGSLFDVIISREHYFFADPYQPYFAHLICLIPLAIVLGHLWLERRRGVFSRIGKVAVGIVLVSIVFEVGRAAKGYQSWFIDTNDTVPIALLNDLDSASVRLPKDALVATRRFNVRKAFAAHPLDIARKDSADWNFEFYAVSLHRPVILEGPLDGFYGGCAATPVDSNLLVAPNPILSKELWRRSRLLDTIYDSRSPVAALQAIQDLGATHVLIDKTIDQRIASGATEGFDTVFSGKAAVLLKVSGKK